MVKNEEIAELDEVPAVEIWKQERVETKVASVMASREVEMQQIRQERNQVDDHRNRWD